MAFSRRSNEHTAGEKFLIEFRTFVLFLEKSSRHKVPVMNWERVCDRCVWMNVNSCCRGVWAMLLRK